MAKTRATLEGSPGASLQPITERGRVLRERIRQALGPERAQQLGPGLIQQQAPEQVPVRRPEPGRPA
jgi:hypothetical protein